MYYFIVICKYVLWKILNFYAYNEFSNLIFMIEIYVVISLKRIL